MQMQGLYARLRRQPWLYDTKHDSLRAHYRLAAHYVLHLGTRLSAVRYRVARSWRTWAQPIRLNLGSGRVPLAGWINVDINPFAKVELWMHLLDRWPIPDKSVETIYIRHCLEHFSERDVLRLLDQCRRVLKPSGGLRIGVPSLELAVEHYLHGDFSFAPWVADTSISQGRRFFRYIMDDGGHGIAFDYGYLSELLQMSGYVHVRRCTGGSTELVDRAMLNEKDNASDLATLYVECRKPSPGQDSQSTPRQ